MQNAITIGIIGHTDHGKTSLVRCLTGIETDCTETEKQRGVSMQCSIAPMKIDKDYTLALIDVPGHEQFLKNTIRGICAVDMVILVVAADDGIMPQTAAHLELVRHLNIQHGFVVLSKADLVDEELIELAELEIREATEDTILSSMPVVKFSAVTRRGISDIKSSIEDVAGQISCKSPQKDIDQHFRLWIDRVRSIPGVGTVACGTILSGTIFLDTPLMLLPDGKKTKARTIEVHNQQVDKAVAGQRVGINLPGISINDVQCGMTLTSPDTVPCARYINVTIHATQTIKDRMRVKCRIGTCASNATLILMCDRTIEEGETAPAQLRFDNAIAAHPGDRIIIIMMNKPIILGGGTILEVSHQKYRIAKASTIIPFLEAMQNGSISDILRTYLLKYPMRAVDEKEVAAATLLPEKKIQRQFQMMSEQGDVLKIAQNGYYLKSNYETMSDHIIATMEQAIFKNPVKPYINKEEIKNKVSTSIDDTLFKHLMHTLTRNNKIQQRDHLFTLPGVTSTLTDEQNELADSLLSYANSIGISPFSAGGFCRQSSESFEKKQVLEALNHLHQEKKLIRLGKETFISPMAIRTIKQCVKQAADEKHNIHLSDCKNILGYGRSKGAVVFEYLDNIGFTLRQGDYRVLRN